MPDNPNQIKDNQELEQLRFERDTEVSKQNRLSHIFFNHWKTSVAKYPELASVKNLTMFTEARRLNPKIPKILFDDYLKGEHYEAEAKRIMAQPLPEINNPSKKSASHQQDDASHEDNHGFARYLDHDYRYKQLVDANPAVVRLRETKPEYGNIETLASREDGSLYLNPVLVGHFVEIGEEVDPFLIEEAARDAFREAHLEAAKFYEANEEHRIYHDPHSDPALARIERKIKEDTEKEVNKQKDFHAEKAKTTFAYSAPKVDPAMIEKDIRLAATKDFVRRYKNKAAVYAQKENETALREAWQAVKDEDASAEALSENSSLTLPVSGSGKITESVDRAGGSSLSEPGGTPTRTPTSSFNPFQNNRRQMPQTSSQKTIAPDRRGPPHSDTRKRRRNPLASKGGQGMGGFNGMGNTAKAIASFIPPQVKVGITIFLLILLLIIIIFLVLSGEQELNDPDNQEIPVKITKVVDKDAVPNPPDSENITYTLNVSYPGTATDILVRDPIPAGAEYVSSDPPGKLLDANKAVTTEKAKVVTVEWSLRDIQDGAPSTEENASPSATTIPSAQKIDIAKYTQPPYSLLAPDGPSDVTYTDEMMANLNTLGSAVAKSQAYLTSKFDPKYVDPFLSVIWTGAIEGTFGDPYSWNCRDNPEITINDGCEGGYYSGGWQVGYGIQVFQAASHLAEDFEVAYGDSSAENADKVQQVGQAVLADSASSSKGKITNPASFPNKNISTLVYEASRGDTAAQQAIAILLMDPNIGAITIALEIAGDIAGPDNWRSTMQGWGSSYYGEANQQLFSNRMSEIAKKYNGEGGGSGGGSSFTPQEIKLSVKPKNDALDTYIINQAFAEVIGAGSKKRSKPGRGDVTCQEPPDYPENLTKAINEEFEIYPEGFDNDHVKWIWETLWCFSGTNFTNMVDNTQLIAVADVGDSRMECDGSDICYIWIGQMPGRESAFKFLLTHELGHVVNYSNTREEIHWTEFENVYAEEKGLSYYGNNAYDCTGSSNIPEDYADTIAYFLNPEAGETTPACDPDQNPPNPFYELNEFPLHLEVVKKILL